ncbi:MAG: hypothetical protein H6584_02170 [Flavobacteriales bacterium]|nr:hypothetical protein [Flavobacteriales bacterium]
MKKIIVIALTVLGVFSCKDKQNEQESSESNLLSENFVVEMEIIAQTPDDFAVYYTEDNTNNFSGVDASWKGITGNNTSEKIRIDLNAKVIPTNIRLDFGINPNRKDVVIKNIHFKYYSKEFVIRGADFLNYFIKNDVPTEINTTEGTIKLIKTQEKTDGTYFYPRQELLDQIKSMTL